MGGLQNMQAVDVPIYDFSRHQRSTATRRVEPADVVLIEGILVLAMDSLREFLNMKIFVVSTRSPLHVILPRVALPQTIADHLAPLLMARGWVPTEHMS